LPKAKIGKKGLFLLSLALLQVLSVAEGSGKIQVDK
jgi:hypothetical protein